MKFLASDSLLYGGAAALSKSISLITFPLLARHFSVEEYGVLDFYMVLASFMALMFVFGQDSAVARFFYEYEDDRSRKQLISQSLGFQLLCLALFLPIAFFSYDAISPLLVQSVIGFKLFLLVVLQAPFLLLFNFCQNLLKWTFNRKGFLLLSLGITSSQAICVVVLIAWFEPSIHDILLAGLGVHASFSLVGLYFIRNWLVFPKSLGYLKELLIFAAPYGVICAISALAPVLERSLVNELLTINDLGLYAVATKMALLVAMATTAFQTAWGPFSIAIYKREDAITTYNSVLTIFVSVIAILVVIITLVSEFAIRLLAGEKYLAASVVVGPLVLGVAIQGVSWITEIGIGLSKKSYLSVYSLVPSLVATFIAIWFLAPLWGLFGVGVAVLVGHGVRAVIASWLAQKYYPMKWDYRLPIVVLTLTGIAILCNSVVGLS